jgi:hypothetical protein
MVRYRHGNNPPTPRKPFQPIQRKPSIQSQPIMEEIELKEKPIETRIENGKVIEIYKYRL